MFEYESIIRTIIATMKISQHVLLDLPTCLLVEILSGWISYRDVGRFDSAVCNKKLRPALLEVLSSTVFNIFKFEPDDDGNGCRYKFRRNCKCCMKWLRHSGEHLLRWLGKRKVTVVGNLLVCGTPHRSLVGDDSLLESKVFSRVQHLLLEHCTLDSSLQTVIAPHCSRLQVLEISHTIISGELLHQFALNCPKLSGLILDCCIVTPAATLTLKGDEFAGSGCHTGHAALPHLSSPRQWSIQAEERTVHFKSLASFTAIECIFYNDALTQLLALCPALKKFASKDGDCFSTVSPMVTNASKGTAASLISLSPPCTADYSTIMQVGKAPSTASPVCVERACRSECSAQLAQLDIRTIAGSAINVGEVRTLAMTYCQLRVLRLTHFMSGSITALAKCLARRLPLLEVLALRSCVTDLSIFLTADDGDTDEEDQQGGTGTGVGAEAEVILIAPHTETNLLGNQQQQQPQQVSAPSVNLHTLILDGNTRLSDDELICLLRLFPATRRLSLRNCRRITSTALRMVPGCLPAVEHVNICMSNVERDPLARSETEHTAAALDIARRCVALRGLDVGFQMGPFLTADHSELIRGLAREAPRELRTLRLGGSPRTNADLARLLQACPLLRRVDVQWHLLEEQELIDEQDQDQVQGGQTEEGSPNLVSSALLRSAPVPKYTRQQEQGQKKALFQVERDWSELLAMFPDLKLNQSSSSPAVK